MSARIPVLAIAVVTFVLSVTLSLGAPLGDPATSKADSRLCGVWEWQDPMTKRAIIRAWDERTYIVDVLAGDLNADGATRPRERTVFKAWLTDIDGQTFLTLQPIESVGTVNGDERKPAYLIGRIKFDGQTMTVAAINMEFAKVKEATSAKELEGVIKANLNDPALFTTPTTVTRWTPEQVKGLDKLQQIFREWKP
ncbi:MAG TPA: hypothetical protein VH475_02200 [Tepidisphaeraceae bacterium]|jgi:hypothetical protein